MCSMCGSAYGGYGSTYNMRNNQPKIQTKKYTIKERLQMISIFYSKFPGYTLSIGPLNQFEKLMKQCKNITIHEAFYKPLTNGSLFMKNIPHDIQFHIKVVNQFLSNNSRPFNHKQNGGKCSNNKYLHLKPMGLVLVSTISNQDSNVISNLHDASIGTGNWSGLPIYIYK